MSIPLRRQIQQIQHKVEAALSVLMSQEDTTYAVDDLHSARNQLKGLEAELAEKSTSDGIMGPG